MKNETQVYYAEVIKDLKSFIASNINRHLSLNFLATKAAVSVFHLSRIFKQLEEITLKKYIHRQKMENALQEVLYTNRRLNDISLKSGFEDYASFCRGFKRIYKVSPDDLRKIILDMKEKNNIPGDAVVCIKSSTVPGVPSELKGLQHNSRVFVVRKGSRNNKKEFSVHPHIIS
jgi:AraC-like DNA-binding protein